MLAAPRFDADDEIIAELTSRFERLALSDRPDDNESDISYDPDEWAGVPEDDESGPSYDPSDAESTVSYDSSDVESTVSYDAADF